MEGRTTFTTSTPTTTIRTASTATIQCRGTRRRRIGITAAVTARTTHTWGAARSHGCRCQLPDGMKSTPTSTSPDVVLRHEWRGGVLRGAAAVLARTRGPNLIRDVALDELRQERQRPLPAETASLGRDDSRPAPLHDIQLGSAGDSFQCNRRLHLAGQARIVESVRVANAFVWHQLQVFSAERVTAAGGEIRERHLVGAADFGLDVVDLTRESVWRKPFGHRVRVEERPIDLLGRCAYHPVKLDEVPHSWLLSMRTIPLLCPPPVRSNGDPSDRHPLAPSIHQLPVR